MTTPRLVRRENRILTLAIVLASAGVAQAFGRFTWGVILPEARDELLDGSNKLAGLFGTINVSAYLIGTIVVAWLSSRLTLVWLVRLGLVFSTSGLAVASFTKDPVILAAALAVMGLGGAIIWVPAPGIAARLFPPHQRGLGTGIAGVGIGLGIVFSGRMAGWFRSGDGDVWQSLYRVELAIAVVVLVLALVGLRSQGERKSAAGGFGGFGALRQVTGWRVLTGAYAAYGFAYILVIGFLVVRLKDDAGFSAERASLVFSIVGVAVIGGGLGIGSLSDRLGRRRTLVGAFLSWAGASLLLLTSNFAAVIVAGVIVGFMFSGIPATIIAHVVTHTDDSTYGPAFSATTLAFGLTQAIAPQIGGVMADWRGSFTLVFVLAAIVALIGAGLSARLPD